MAVSRALSRLLRIRNLEEEQRRLVLESAMGERDRLQRALDAAAQRESRGRRLVEASARSGELPDRLAGVEETRLAVRHAEVLEPRIAEMELEIAELRQEFLSKRVERRQAETVIEEGEARDAVVAGRRSQQNLDDWHRNRMWRREAAALPNSGSPDESKAHTTKAVILSDRSAAQGVEGPAFAFSTPTHRAVILSDRSAAQGVEGPAFAFSMPTHRAVILSDRTLSKAKGKGVEGSAFGATELSSELETHHTSAVDLPTGSQPEAE
jgi:hypothetical protein